MHARRGDRPNLLDEAAKAGLGPHTIKHEGGAAIDIRLEGAGVKGVKTRASGLINAVNLKRGPTMTEPSVSA